MITILSGTNNFLLRAEQKRLVATFVADHDAMALEKLDGDDASFQQIQEALQSLPFLSDKKMIVLQSPGNNKMFVEKAEKLLNELPETTELILVEPKLDKRSAYYKFLKKQPGYQEYHDLDERGLAQWLVGLAKDKGASLNTADALFLIGRVGTNQQTLANEIEKLFLYVQTDDDVADGAHIGRDAIEALSPATPQSTIFQLLEMAFAGNTRRAMQLYGEQRALKVEPQQIIAMLAWQLHVLALVKTAGNKTPDEIARDARISPYVVRKCAPIARRLSMLQMKRLIRDLLEIDERLKREALNADDALQNYLMTMTE